MVPRSHPITNYTDKNTQVNLQMLQDDSDPQANIKRNNSVEAHSMETTDACSISSLSSESDLSLAFDRELDEPADSDELPAFDLRAFSPHGRTPSPIDSDMSGIDMVTPKQQQLSSPKQPKSPGRHNNPNYVALHEINAQISPPNDSHDEDSTTGISHANSLETIFEGVFLQTPPRPQLNRSNGSSTGGAGPRKRSRANLLELVAMNRMQTNDKENKSPAAERKLNNGELT